ncbi:pyridoxal-dependent decarboxylase conserved domain-containing protein [Epithele typhae]|uniref:pyridoxal-dependent decarboxylase conserved domain-containing protein n=1 Tax=Epithele typhae TaxID=378194 RepID=UPI002008E310|nr:pyridoxal-dependent decarboxylase conserved domain-containing protein [Epithele typhae]KAH9919189.1 pyridoxal-dependent decarboxylase conserved domain-containing protein [Epithele typhae]
MTIPRIPVFDGARRMHVRFNPYNESMTIDGPPADKPSRRPIGRFRLHKSYHSFEFTQNDIDLPFASIAELHICFSEDSVKPDAVDTVLFLLGRMPALTDLVLDFSDCKTAFVKGGAVDPFAVILEPLLNGSAAPGRTLYPHISNFPKSCGVLAGLTRVSRNPGILLQASGRSGRFGAFRAPGRPVQSGISGIRQAYRRVRLFTTLLHSLSKSEPSPALPDLNPLPQWLRASASVRRTARATYMGSDAGKAVRGSTPAFVRVESTDLVGASSPRAPRTRAGLEPDAGYDYMVAEGGGRELIEEAVCQVVEMGGGWNLEDALFRELTTQAAAGDIPQAKVTLSAWPGIDYHDLNLKNDNSKIVRVVAPVLFNLVILTGRPEDVHHRLGVHHRTPDLGVRARLRLPTIFALQRKLLFRATIERLARSPNVLMIHGRPVLIPLADLACFWLHHEATGMARREGGARPRPQVATIGTTNTGAMDRVDEIGQILKDYPFIWLHVDAAWAGISFACPEYCEQSQLAAINEHAKSFCTNFHKGLVNFDATALWVCQRHDLIDALDVTPAFLRTKQYDAVHTLERGAVALVERRRRRRRLNPWIQGFWKLLMHLGAVEVNFGWRWHRLGNRIAAQWLELLRERVEQPVSAADPGETYGKLIRCAYFPGDDAALPRTEDGEASIRRYWKAPTMMTPWYLEAS